MTSILKNIAESKTLLLLEDDEITSEVMSEILQKSFSKVIICENGQEGLEIIDMENIDCIICDVSMPLMDGITFHQHLMQKHHRSIPFLFLSAHEEIGYARQLNIPALVKPVTLSILQQMIVKIFQEA